MRWQVYKAIDSVQLYIVNRKQTSALQYTSLFEPQRPTMSTPIQIVEEKNKQLHSLWESQQFDELLSTGYTPDASITDGKATYKGHDELKQAFEKLRCLDLQLIAMDTIASGDSIKQISTCQRGGAAATCTVTWNKVGADWKITNEHWT
ncbi:unnamed protein product [Rotaria magnacalcarata]